MDKFSYIANAHVAYIDELYATYTSDPESLDPSWKTFFDGFDFAISKLQFQMQHLVSGIAMVTLGEMEMLG